MSAGHTPGPWMVSPFIAQVEQPFGEPICKMLWPTDVRSEKATYANARLIAAAPELLEALEEAALQLEYMDERSPSGTTPAVLTRIRAAIAKARGQ